jgi:hypothetical protein
MLTRSASNCSGLVEAKGQSAWGGRFLKVRKPSAPAAAVLNGVQLGDEIVGVAAVEGLGELGRAPVL